MHATIRSYSGGGDFADLLVPRQSEIRDVISSIPGFRAYYLVRTAGGATTISIFDDESGAEESTQAAAAWIAENLADASPGAPQVTSGEVAVSF